MTEVIIWTLAGVGAVLAWFAARAYLLERREGLPRSTRRLAASATVAVALAGLAGFAQLRGAPPPQQQPRPPVQVDAATRARIDELKQRVAAASAELAKHQAELATLDPSAEPVPLPSEPSAWPLLVAFALLLFGFAALALGDLATLIPQRRKRASSVEAAPAASGSTGEPPPAPADLPALIAHAQAGRWSAGVACGSRIAIERLSKLEQLDLLYVRALCAVSSVAAPEGSPLPHQERTERLAAAKADLASVLSLAPHMAEARWLAGYVAAHAGAWQEGLDAMRAARPILDPDLELPFANNESVCLLMLAEERLGAADNAGATARFDEVAQLGVLGAQIPIAMVTHRILTVREHLKAGKFADASDGIARIRAIEKEAGDLEAATGRAMAIACDVYDVAIRYRANELDAARAAIAVFFARWLPADLPVVDDQVADEYLLPAIDKAALVVPADLFRGLFFLEAVARVAQASRRAQPLAAGEVDAIAEPLLRALQFQPRHRESLAALAALYLAYRPERTEKALAWLDAALTMGVRSARAHGLLAEHQRAERERTELLAMFRSASAKFLADPAVGVAVRRALVEELGRFEEFRPVVLELQSAGALETPPAPLTVAALRERAAFVGSVAAEVGRRGDPKAVQTLVEASRELTALAANVDTSITRITALERAVMQQLGKAVLR